VAFLTFDEMVFFAVLSLGASLVNGALGYGYSSISTPLAILVVANRILNPAYVMLEVLLNTVMFVVSGKGRMRSTVSRVSPILVGVLPGVIVGTFVLAVAAPVWIKLAVYAAILPLILLQAAGKRRPIGNERAAGAPLGFGVGFLYSLTTISGPPTALFFNNQGMTKDEFKASIAQVRIAESYLTMGSYFALGLFSAQSLSLFAIVAPPVVVGIPVGVYLVKRIPVEVFRRVCMSFDAWIVGFGIRTILVSFYHLPQAVADIFWVTVILIDAGLLWKFFSARRAVPGRRSRSPDLPEEDGIPLLRSLD
jgi:uncharacterized protein